MIFRSWPQSSNTAKIALISCLLLTSCTHITYTPEESAARISLLEQRNKALELLWVEAEEDLAACIDRLKQCQPLISDPAN